MAKPRSKQGGQPRKKQPTSWFITPGTAEEVERAELLYVPGHPPAMFLAPPSRERLESACRILARALVKQIREERRLAALAGQEGVPLAPATPVRTLGPRAGCKAPPEPRTRRLPDWVTTAELGQIFGWPEETFLTAVAYGHMLGAVLRDDGQLEVSRDAVHAWVRLDWYDGERRRAARGLPEPRKKKLPPQTADGRGLRDALLQTIEAGVSADALLSELERAESTGARLDPVVGDDLLRRTDALLTRLRPGVIPPQ